MTEDTWRKSWGRLINKGGRVRRGAAGRSRSPFLRLCRELEAKARPLESPSAAGEGGTRIRDCSPVLAPDSDNVNCFPPIGGQTKGRDCRRWSLGTLGMD